MAGRDAPSAKARLDKIGVKPGAKVHLDGIFDAAFHEELRERGVHLVPRVVDADVVFLAVFDPEALLRLGALRKELQDEAALWCVWPKGRQALKEDHIRAAALADGLVDVKVVKWSESHSGLKLVVPRAARASAPSSRRLAASSSKSAAGPAKKTAASKEKPAARGKGARATTRRARTGA